MSYVCDICKCISCPEYDGSPRELGFHECTHGHIVCNECWCKDVDDEDQSDETTCPICNFTDISDKEMIKTFYKVLDIKRVKKILLSSFNNKSDFDNWLSSGPVGIYQNLQEKLKECQK